MTELQLLLLKRVGHAILSTLQECQTDGPVPAGPVYAALQAHGCSLSQFQSLMDGLVSKKLVERDGFMLSITEEGRATIPRFEREIAQLKIKLGMS